METIFKIPKDLSTGNDAVLDFIEEVSKQDFNFPSGLVFVQLMEASNDFSAIKKKLQEGDQSWGVLAGLIESMQEELQKLVQQFIGFYKTKSDYASYCNDGLSPLEINYLINAALIRIKRMRCVLNPDYNKIDFQDKKTQNRYTMIKGYWIKDDGTRGRNFSKSISNKEATLNDIIIKIIKSNLKNAELMEPDKNYGFRPDLVVFDGKHRWAIEVKLQNKDSLIKTYVMFEMWKLYKQTYELIS